MCYDRYARRRREEEVESKRIWEAFEWTTTPVSEREPQEVDDPKVDEPEPAELSVASER